MFRPFKGEIIVGRISSASEWGMKSVAKSPLSWNTGLNSPTVQLDFFDDILVPPSLMFPGSIL